jgi:hypothetical protein
MFWRLGGQFLVAGGWLVQAHGYPPKKHKYVFVLYAYCVLIAYYTVWDVSEVRMTHPYLLLYYYQIRNKATRVCS